MSKIYEALLRAESERSLAKGGSAAGAASAVAELLMPIEEAEAFPSETQPREFPAEAAIPDAAAPSDLSFEACEPRRTIWTPKFSSLPALEERGEGIEQFRSLRSHVTEFREQRPLKTILVSSGLPGEGKSFVAMNLALAFARHKTNRVLLIDGDMRRSSLHKLLGAPREPGLSEYLSGEAALAEVLQQAQPQTGTPLPQGIASLTFIPGGRDADRAGDLAANTRFEELLRTVQPSFDWIIVDSSPVNLVSDAASLARSCDGVLLVSREGVTRYKTAQQAQAQFKNAHILGFVLNAVHHLPKADYYGSYDSYSNEGVAADAA